MDWNWYTVEYLNVKKLYQPFLSECLSLEVLSLRWPLDPRLLLLLALAEDAEETFWAELPVKTLAPLPCAGPATGACLLPGPDCVPFPPNSEGSATPFCSLDLTISCLASDVFVPGFVLFIFIFNPLSVVAECSMCILAVAAALDACGPPPVFAAILATPLLPLIGCCCSLVFSISASKSIIRSPMPVNGSSNSVLLVNAYSYFLRNRFIGVISRSASDKITNTHSVNNESFR